jgi:hypothetical protein
LGLPYFWLRVQARISSSHSFASTVGGIGFSAGFFGPIIFAPEANQGPLLGIFITGPLGFLIGSVGGFVYWFTKASRTGAT